MIWLKQNLNLHIQFEEHSPGSEILPGGGIKVFRVCVCNQSFVSLLK